MTIVVALNYRQFLDYCMENDINPRRPEIGCLTTGTVNRSVRGRHRKEGDRIITYGQWYLGKHVAEVRDILLACGYREVLDW